MQHRDDILQELIELNSRLAVFSKKNVFHVPESYFNELPSRIMAKLETARNLPVQEELPSGLLPNVSRQAPYSPPPGYFDGLAENLLNVVKASEASQAAEELSSLSPLLSSISKQNVYEVPTGYFDSLDRQIAQTVNDENEQSVQEELELISPLLASFKKLTPYSVPVGYFENLQYNVATENIVQTTKVVSITGRRWFRYAAAALVIGFVATIALLLINKPKAVDPSEKSFAWVQKNMKKVSTDEISEFIELANTGNTDAGKPNGHDDIKDLLKDVSDKEIQDFLNETQPAVTETDDDQIMN